MSCQAFKTPRSVRGSMERCSRPSTHRLLIPASAPGGPCEIGLCTQHAKVLRSDGSIYTNRGWAWGTEADLEDLRVPR